MDMETLTANFFNKAALHHQPRSHQPTRVLLKDPPISTSTSPRQVLQFLRPPHLWLNNFMANSTWET